MREEDRGRKFAETFQDSARQAMMDRGATEEQAREVMRHAFRKDRRREPIGPDHVRRLIPTSSDAVIRAVAADLDRARQWNLDSQAERVLQGEPRERLNRFLRRHYRLPARPPWTLQPYHMALVAGDRLRDAMLAYLARAMAGEFTYPNPMLQRLPPMAGRWPFATAEPILRRCVEIGWRSSLRAVPDTLEWQAFLDGYQRTPFGEGGQLVDWWVNRKLRRERGLE